MPDMEETKIEVGDADESPVDVDLSGDKKEEPQKEEPEVEVEGDEKEEELNEYARSAKGRISDLTAKYREEERQKQTAIQFAESVRQENENLKTRLENLDKGYQEEFDNRVTSQIDSAKRILKEAHESGDIDKLVDAQEALATLSVEKGKLSVAKKETEEQVVAAPAAAPAQVAPAAQPAPPPDPRAQAWAEHNKWFGQDEPMTYAAFGIHRRLVEDEGFDPQSETYYSEIDKRLKAEFPHKLGQTDASNGGSKKVASAEASASRTKGRRKKVRLTASQVAIAKRLNVPLEEYAKYVRD
jgi:hypothetical protein